MLRRPVQAHVRPRRGDLDRRLIAGQLVDAERGVVLAQHVVHRVGHPGGVAQLECVADAARQLLEKLLEPLDIHFPPRRKLPQDRSELAPEPLRARDEVPDPAARIFELDHVRDEAASLHGEQEIMRHRLLPPVERSLGGQVVERVVQLHRVEVAQVVREHAGRTNVGGVIASDPVLVVVARRADANLSHGTDAGRAPARPTLPPLLLLPCPPRTDVGDHHLPGWRGADGERRNNVCVQCRRRGRRRSEGAHTGAGHRRHRARHRQR